MLGESLETSGSTKKIGKVSAPSDFWFSWANWNAKAFVNYRLVEIRLRLEAVPDGKTSFVIAAVGQTGRRLTVTPTQALAV
jgi:hypothetical protein